MDVAIPSAVNGKPLRVLVVDDDPAVCAVMTHGLSRAGYQAVGAVDADTALEYLASDAVDVLVADLHLPGVRGTALADSARAIAPALRVLYVSGFFEEGNSGLHPRDAELQKPFSPGMLAAAVAKLAMDGVAHDGPAL